MAEKGWGVWEGKKKTENHGGRRNMDRCKASNTRDLKSWRMKNLTKFSSPCEQNLKYSSTKAKGFNLCYLWALHGLDTEAFRDVTWLSPIHLYFAVMKHWFLTTVCRNTWQWNNRCLSKMLLYLMVLIIPTLRRTVIDYLHLLSSERNLLQKLDGKH